MNSSVLLNKKQKAEKYFGIILFALFATAYTVLSFYLFYNQCTRPNNLFLSDIYAYMANAKRLNNSYPLYFLIISFFDLFFSLETATATATVLLNTLNLFIAFYYTKTLINSNLDPKEPFPYKVANSRSIESTIAVMAVLLCTMLIIPIEFLYKYPGQYYIGAYTGNIWHNATSLATRPFATIAFFEFIRLLKNYRKSIDIKGNIVFGIALFLSTISKPTFSFVFIPVAGIVMLCHLFRDRWKNFKNSLALGLSFVPTFLVLALQYLKMFHNAPSGNKISFGLGIVWNYYSQCIPVSMLLATAFPLFILLTNLKELKTCKYLWFSWAVFLCGFLQAFFIFEDGPRLLDANFFWGYHHALYFIFFVSIIIYFVKFKEKSKLQRTIGGVLLASHFASGVWYFANLLQGNKFM